MYYLKKKNPETKKKASNSGTSKIKRKPDLKAKLDKEFSLFIRLRDSKPYGYKYFKCPTCGRVLPFGKDMEITLDMYFTGKTHFGQMVTLCNQSEMSVRKPSRSTSKTKGSCATPHFSSPKLKI